MIISRTPLRMSFVGGGSDLPAFYREFGGAVLSAAIDKYVYVTVNRKFDDAIRLSYSRTEEVADPSQLQHPLVRAAFGLLGLKGGVEIATVADIPSRGTGLGSSSSFTIALLHALHAFQGRHVTHETLASQCCHIEIDLCGEPIGKQDQYAAAYGGFNLIEFQPDDSVRVSPLICPAATVQTLRENTLVFYTGITRSASALLREQGDAVRQSGDKKAALRRMVALAYAMRDELQNGNVDACGPILHENWALKKSLASGISSGDIDAWYEAGMRNGATGGKILGAGAGGFLLFYAPRERHEAIRRALPALRPIDMGFPERMGSQIIFYH